jgi:lipopolysaccharide export LptBFGC system permease protein LptF
MPEAGPDTLPGEPTEPYTPTFDTGDFPSAPDLLQPLAAEAELQPVTDEAPSEPLPAPAQPVAVPGSYQYLKRWTFVLVVAAVWIVAAVIGLGLYYWWFHSLDKTPAVFVVLIYLVVCTVGSLLTAMVQNKPLVSAVSIALMSAPFAAVGGAAVLHGIYFCDRVARCLVGLIPY